MVKYCMYWRHFWMLIHCCQTDKQTSCSCWISSTFFILKKSVISLITIGCSLFNLFWSQSTWTNRPRIALQRPGTDTTFRPELCGMSAGHVRIFMGHMLLRLFCLPFIDLLLRQYCRVEDSVKIPSIFMLSFVVMCLCYAVVVGVARSQIWQRS